MRKRNTSHPILIAAFIFSILFAASSAQISKLNAEEGEVTLSFGLKEGQTLTYKGKETLEMNYGGYIINQVHGDDVEISLVEILEEGQQRIAIKYLDCSDRRSMGGAAMADFDNPVKPKGKTVKAVIGANGRLDEVQGFILGLKAGRELERYIGKWVLELPEGPVSKGSKWTIVLPREGEEDEDDELEVKGTIHLVLKKFGKEKGIEIAEIESKGELTVHSDTERGVLDGRIKVEGKYKIALEGGYIVKAETSSEMKGERVASNSSGKEEVSKFSNIRYVETKLEK